VAVAARRSWVDELRETHQSSIRLSCKAACMAKTSYYYQHKKDDDDEIVDVLLKLVEREPKWGFPKCRDRIRALGYGWNHKRIYRVYTQLRLNLRRKHKRRLPTRNPEPLAVPNAPNECLSIDFMSDKLNHGTRFRTLNIIDDYNREVLAIDINLGIPADRLIRVLDNVASERGYPKMIRTDNGPEFTSNVFENWAYEHGIKIDYIKPGRPTQNAYIELFNRTYRESVLDMYLFNRLSEVRKITDEWIYRYNHQRPHDSLGRLTPVEYLKANTFTM
jgi:putative transposase